MKNGQIDVKKMKEDMVSYASDIGPQKVSQIVDTCLTLGNI